MVELATSKQLNIAPATTSLLKPLHSDILILSEVAPPRYGNPLGAHWVGDNAPGLAVVARTDLNLIPHPGNVGAPPLMCGFKVNGSLEFDLLAVWPVQGKKGPSYHDVLMAGLNRYENLLSSERTIMAGDFNSNTRVSNQQRSHPQFVQEVESLGLVSAYHTQSNEAHGEETTPTYMHGSGNTREFHIDYCFIAKRLAPSANVGIQIGGDWSQRSDHYPVILDIPNEALTEEHF